MITPNQFVLDNPFKVMDVMQDRSDLLKVKKGQVIYMEGSTPLGAYLVQQGKVKISKIGSDGKEQILRIAVPEEMLTYTDLISNARYTTSAKALEDTTLLFVPKNEFWSTLRANANLFEEFLILVSNDLNRAEQNITSLAYKPVRGRLADALLALGKKLNSVGDGPQSIFISRYDLACYVGTAKETVNRLLSEFRNENLVSTNGTEIIIDNLRGLMHISKMYN